MFSQDSRNLTDRWTQTSSLVVDRTPDLLLAEVSCFAILSQGGGYEEPR
jgi:hypothetical protein